MLQRLTTPRDHDPAELRELEDADAAHEIQKYLDLADIALGRKLRPFVLKREHHDLDDALHPDRAA